MLQDIITRITTTLDRKLGTFPTLTIELGIHYSKHPGCLDPCPKDSVEILLGYTRNDGGMGADIRHLTITFTAPVSTNRVESIYLTALANQDQMGILETRKYTSDEIESLTDYATHWLTCQSVQPVDE